MKKNNNPHFPISLILKTPSPSIRPRLPQHPPPALRPLLPALRRVAGLAGLAAAGGRGPELGGEGGPPVDLGKCGGTYGSPSLRATIQ